MLKQVQHDNGQNLMDYTNAAITYGLLLIPSFFAIGVIGQGAYKMSKHDASGKIVLGMGVFFLLLIPAAYFLLIKV